VPLAIALHTVSLRRLTAVDRVEASSATRWRRPSSPEVVRS
jgi:hypothetical protein